MSELSKEEVSALIETHTKTALQLQAIANSLAAISAHQEKLLEKIPSNEVILGIDKTVKDNRDNLNWLKIIIGSATLIMMLASFMINYTQTKYVNSADKEIINKIESIIEHHSKMDGIK